MPQSKNRKKRIADHHKRLERTRRKLERERAYSFSGSLSGASEKENSNIEQDYIAAGTHFVDSRADRLSVANRDDDKALWGGFSNISNLYSWCHSGLASGVASARDMLFPSRVLRKELEAAQQRMAQLEEELEQVKKAKRRRKSMSCCNDNGVNVLDVGQMSVAPPPPPPPPPLPPPPPPSLMSVTKRSSVRIKAMKEKQCHPVVSLEELKSVRLRKPQDRRLSTGKVKRRKSTDGPGCERQLCRSSGARRSVRELRRQSLNVEPCLLRSLRGSLRRVDIERSPGGTPLLPIKDYSGCGDGIGPVLTRALKRKFEAAYPREDLPSHAEKNSYPSPLVSSLITASATPPPPPPPNTADTSMLDAHITLSPLSVSVRDV